MAPIEKLENPALIESVMRFTQQIFCSHFFLDFSESDSNVCKSIRMHKFVLKASFTNRSYSITYILFLKASLTNCSSKHYFQIVPKSITYKLFLKSSLTNCSCRITYKLFLQNYLQIVLKSITYKLFLQYYLLTYPTKKSCIFE